jgi:hypothetical protein
MSVFDRVGRVVRAEWSHLRRKKPDEAAPVPDDDQKPVSRGQAPAPRPRVNDVDGALRVLELSGTPTLDEVRARYHAMSRRYFPKTQSPRADEAHAARVVLEALTDALELLEEHLLPVPPE